MQSSAYMNEMRSLSLSLCASRDSAAADACPSFWLLEQNRASQSCAALRIDLVRAYMIDAPWVALQAISDHHNTTSRHCSVVLAGTPRSPLLLQVFSIFPCALLSEDICRRLLLTTISIRRDREKRLHACSLDRVLFVSIYCISRPRNDHHHRRVVRIVKHLFYCLRVAYGQYGVPT